MQRLLLMAGIFLLAAGRYAEAGVPPKSKLDSCISYYRDGDYQKTADSLKTLLPLISDRLEEAEAYKYLGFSYVMLDQLDKARDFFRVALDKFPRMTIDTLEVPPNVAVVFKQTRIERQIDKGELVEKKPPGPGRKLNVLPALCIGTGTLGVGVGGYFFIKGYQAHRDYENTINDFNVPWNRMKKELIIGSCVTALAAADLCFGLHLYFIKSSTPMAGVSLTGNRLAVDFDF